MSAEPMTEAQEKSLREYYKANPNVPFIVELLATIDHEREHLKALEIDNASLREMLTAARARVPQGAGDFKKFWRKK